MMMDRPENQHELQAVEWRIAVLTAELAKLEGARDRLIMAETDLTGAHDRRPVAVR
jgi:hypothetical protein